MAATIAHDGVAGAPCRVTSTGRPAGAVVVRSMRSRTPHPSVVRALMALLALALACGPRPAAPPRVERVVLVTIDTLRADHVGSYGAGAASTPSLDAVAARGVRFARAVSPAPLTLPSHTTLMTGLDPFEHGVRHNSIFRLADDVPTLAERMRDAGFATAAFIGAFVLDQRFGLARGFDVYDDEMGYRRASASDFSFAERRGDEVVDAALAWLESAPERFFLWAHLYDPHVDYRAPPGFALSVSGGPYEAEVAFADAQVGRLVAAIDARWPPGSTLIVVTSDHGEGLGEHGEKTHSYFVYQQTQHIPLLIAGPGFPAGRVVEPTVRLSDVAPTLLARAGAAPLEGISGRDLFPLAMGRDEEEGRVGYVETLAPQLDLELSPLLGLRTDRFKYIRAPRPELYDLERDPGELRDLASERPELLAELDDALEQRLARSNSSSFHALPDAADRARLESLGYVVPEGLPEAASLGRVGGRDPKDYIGVGESMAWAEVLIAEGRYAEALALLPEEGVGGPRFAFRRAIAALGVGETAIAERAARELIARGNALEGQVLLGSALMHQERFREARAIFEEAAAAHPLAPNPVVSLADLAVVEGRREDAHELYRRAIELSERPVDPLWAWAALLIEDGRREEAEALLAPLPEERLLEPAPALRLAEAERAVGREDAAIDRLTAAVRRYPNAVQLLMAQAELLEANGRLEEALPSRERLVELDPENPLHQNNLAFGLVRLGRDLDRALALVQGAIAKLGRHEALLDTLAAVHLERGEAAEALRVSQEGLATAREDAQAHLHYLAAEAHRQLGDRAAARRAIRAALRAQQRDRGSNAEWIDAARALERELARP